MGNGKMIMEIVWKKKQKRTYRNHFYTNYISRKHRLNINNKKKQVPLQQKIKQLVRKRKESIFKMHQYERELNEIKVHSNKTPSQHKREYDNFMKETARDIYGAQRKIRGPLRRRQELNQYVETQTKDDYVRFEPCVQKVEVLYQQNNT